MKKIWLSIALISCAASLDAQSQTKNLQDGSRANYAVIERGPHHKVWERVEVELTPDGTPVERRKSYRELATGMHFKNERGEWEESKEIIEILPNNAGAMAAKGPHKAIFPVEIKSGLIELQSPDGKWLRSRVWGLAYFDSSSGESVLLAEVKESDGQLVGDNVVVYPDSFTDIHADVRYTYTRANFEQDIILRENPPSPADFGLNPKTTRLQVLTEFVETQPPRKIDHQIGVLSDETLAFDEITIGAGKAFSISSSGQTGEDLPVAKKWERLEQRDFLIEEINYEQIIAPLRALPAARKNEGASIERRGKGESALAGLRQFLPKSFAKRDSELRSGFKRLAKADFPSGPSFVMDYLASLNGSITNYTFRSDTTYYISGALAGHGTNTFEGGAVLKYATNAYLSITPGPTGYPRIQWNADPYNPVIFTAKDDDTVGTPISESSGIPSGANYANPALRIIAPAVNPTISNFRILFAKQAVELTATTTKFYHGQIVSCQNGFTSSGGGYGQLRNVLFSGVQTNFNQVYAGGFVVENATFNGSSYLTSIKDVAGHGFTVNLTNCVLVNVTNLTNSYISTSLGYNIYARYNGFYNSPLYGTDTVIDTNQPLQSVGAGFNYLRPTSPFRDCGTTNIDTSLLNDLRRRTTYSPYWLTNTIQTNTTLEIYAARDTNAPDLGYHYAPIDYFVSCQVTNANIIVTNGSVISYYDTRGLWLDNGAKLISVGSPLARNQFVYYALAQEQPLRLYQYSPASSLPISALHLDPGRNPEMLLNFTSFRTVQGAYYSLYAGYVAYDVKALVVKNCEFYGRDAGIILGPVVLVETNNSFQFVNNLFDVSWAEFQTEFYSDSTFELRNNSFVNASVGVYNFPSSAWLIRDNIFSGGAVHLNGIHGHNAYVNNANVYSAIQTNDLVVTNFVWQTGTLGNYYLPAGSILINTGSVTAAAVGLYHFTTQTNQTREGNSQVDIGYHYVALGTNGLPIDSDNNGRPDYLEDLDCDGLGDDWELLYFGNLAQTSLGDYDYDGRRNLDEYLEGTSPTSATSVANVLLARWTFDNTNSWVGEQGQLPTLVLNAQGRPSPRTNAAYLYNTNGAYLKYRDLEADGQANINCQRGTLRYWFKPEWSSANVGGTGPQAHGTMVWLGINTTNFWGVTIRPDGNSGHLTTKGPGETAMFGTTRDFPTTNWYSNTWHQIAITYSASQTKFYVDGQLVATNVGITYFPSAADRTNGFLFGTPNSGNQSRGQFEELETYNYELSQAEVLAAFQASDLADADGDGVPVKEDIDPTNPNIGRLRIIIEHPSSGALVP